VEGKGNLYQYSSKNMERFFFTNLKSNIEQLLYRRYLIGQSIITDPKFQDQLKFNLKCPNFNAESYSSLIYSKKSMVSFFREFNECNDVKSYVYIDTRKRDLFNLTFNLGLNSVSLSLRNSAFNNKYNKQVNLDSHLGLKFGIEAEFVLPYNNNKWNILIQSEYQSFKENTNAESSVNYKVDYKSLDIPISVRYKMFSSSKSTFYLSSGVVFNFPFNSTIIRNGSSFDVGPTPNLIAEFGYIFNKKVSIEFSISSKRELFDNYAQNFAKYQYSSLTFGYSLF
tara:strand:+ start:9071 stop:9916 length:846 start_codon:yes stop_codon:yes gene_type:complete